MVPRKKAIYLVQTVDFFRGIDDPATAGTLRVHFPRVLRVAGTEQYYIYIKKKKRIKKEDPSFLWAKGMC